jgi:hypothetical protein
MVQNTLTQEDREKILNDYVFPVADLSDFDVDYILAFLDKYKYQRHYNRRIYFKRPKDWTPAYAQAADKIGCFFRYGNVLNNGIN